MFKLTHRKEVEQKMDNTTSGSATMLQGLATAAGEYQAQQNIAAPTNTTYGPGRTTGTVKDTGTTSYLDPQTLQALQAFTQALTGNVVGGREAGYDKAAAMADAQGVVANIFKQYKETALPTIFGAQNASGGYNSAAGQMLANDAFARATNESAKTVLGNVKDYAAINAQDIQNILKAFEVQKNAVVTPDLTRTTDMNTQQGGSTAQKKTDNTGAYVQGAATIAAAMIMACARTLKEDFTPVNHQENLHKLDALKVETWRYKDATDGLPKHLGPYAEDFKEVYDLGTGEMIPAVDAFGLCLSCIKALKEQVVELKAEVEHLKVTKLDFEE